MSINPPFAFPQRVPLNWDAQLQFLRHLLLAKAVQGRFSPSQVCFEAQKSSTAPAPAPTCPPRERVCRKSWKPDQFGEGREGQTINSSNGKLCSQCLLGASSHLTKGSHWDAPTKGRKFNFCSLECNDLCYLSQLKTWAKQSMAVFPSRKTKQWTSRVVWGGWLFLCLVCLFVCLIGFQVWQNGNSGGHWISRAPQVPLFTTPGLHLDVFLSCSIKAKSIPWIFPTAERGERRWVHTKDDCRNS